MNRIFQWVILLTIGLIVVVVGCGTVQWVSELSMWTRTDSGWIQAIGSIAALAVAIYVMSRQNTHSLNLLLGAEKRALVRRADTVNAILRRGHRQINLSLDALETAANANNVAGTRLQWKLACEVSQRFREILTPIPLHELGAVELARGLHETYVALALFDHAAANFLNNPAISPNLASTPTSCEMVRKRIKKASDEFQKGLTELKSLV